MMRITFEGKPISVNQLYTGRRFLTPKGKATKEAYGWAAKKQYKGKLITCDVDVQITFYFENKRSDIDNCLKAALDSLTGIVWEDDSQIQSILVVKYIDKENPRTEIEVIVDC
jgi:Holliday junction resolvase RusA-like endonuclease